MKVLNVLLVLILKPVNWLLNLIRSLSIRYHGSPRKLKKAIAKADKLNKKTCKRFRVYFLNGRYRVLTRIQVQRLKHSGAWKPGVNMTSLEHYQFYDTFRN
jgi:hypothetical protein